MISFRQKIINLFRFFANTWKDENFLSAIDELIRIISKLLAIAMVVVICFTLWDLIKFLTLDLFFSDQKRNFSAHLLKVFGMFLNVLIALELLENFTAYLRHHVVQLQLVIITALTAVARKIIIYDAKVDGDVTGLAIAVLSLSISYWIVHQSREH